nr:ferritin-like domain-containing protein [Kitasatospora sp. MAA19]
MHAVALGDTTASATPPAAAGTPTETPTAPPGDKPTGSPSPSATPSTAAAVTALQGALGAEHAAVYGYGVVGARLPEDQQRADARTAYAAHEARRDSWQRLLASLGATPTAAAGGYQLPFAVTDTAGATRLAAHLETRLTAVYADLVAAVPGPQRSAAADALRECALRAHRWGAADTAFPGIPEPLPTPTAAPTATRP